MFKKITIKLLVTFALAWLTMHISGLVLLFAYDQKWLPRIFYGDETGIILIGLIITGLTLLIVLCGAISIARDFINEYKIVRRNDE